MGKLSGKTGRGMAKHRKSGKNNRNATNNMQIAREQEAENKARKEMLERRKPKMFGSVAEALKKG